MLELVAYQSAPTRVALQAWACLLRRLPASAMAHSTGSSGAGPGFIRFRFQVASGVQLVGIFNSLAEIVVAVCVQGAPPSCQSLVLVAEVRDCAAPPCFVHDHVVEGAVEDGAGQRGARFRLDAALEAAEDGFVAMLRVRRAVRWDEAQDDLKETSPHGGKGGLGGVNCWQFPRVGSKLVLPCQGPARRPGQP